MSTIDEETVTFTITREDLLKVGALVDISKQAHEAGVRPPVAITAGVNQLVRDGVGHHQDPLLPTPDIETVYYDIAWMLLLNVLRPNVDRLRVGQEYAFPVIIGAAEYELEAICTPEGRDGALVLTVLLPGED